MIFIVIGNIIALAACLCTVYLEMLEKPKDVIYVRCIQKVMFTSSNIVLGGFSGAIINLINLARNIISYKNKLNIVAKIVLTIISIFLCIYINNLGIIGYLPLLGSLTFLWLMNIKDEKKSNT